MERSNERNGDIHGDGFVIVCDGGPAETAAPAAVAAEPSGPAIADEVICVQVRPVKPLTAADITLATLCGVWLGAYLCLILRGE